MIRYAVRIQGGKKDDLSTVQLSRFFSCGLLQVKAGITSSQEGRHIMFKTIFATTFAIALALPATTALASSAKDCALSQLAFVQPQTARVQQGHAVPQRWVGATLYAPAQPGLTTDWLKRLVTDHQAEMARGEPMKDCVLGVANSHVDVWSTGSGYLIVGVQSDNLDTAKEILRRAAPAVK